MNTLYERVVNNYSRGGGGWLEIFCDGKQFHAPPPQMHRQFARLPLEHLTTFRCPPIAWSCHNIDMYICIYQTFLLPPPHPVNLQKCCGTPLSSPKYVMPPLFPPRHNC